MLRQTICFNFNINISQLYIIMKALLTFFITSFCSYLASGNNFFIALKQKNTDILLDAFNNVSNPESSHYGHFWQQSEINDLVSPPQNEINLLITHLTSYDIHCIQRGGDSLECSPLLLEKPLLVEKYPIIDFIEVPLPNLYKHPYKVGNGDGFVGREV